MTRRWAFAGLALTPILAVGAGQTARSGIQPLPQSFCSPVVYHGKGSPRLLLVSDLPLQGVRGGAAERMASAVEYTLARHQFRAGRYTIGYQSCADSNPQTGAGDIGRCVSNAKAYAGDASVVGVIGTWSSRCSGYEIPILNKTARQPVALVSPSNTYVGLTHAGAGTAPGEPRRYYPTGTRNFARVIGPDDVEGVAGALLAKRLGVKRIFVLDDQDEFGLDTAVPFASTARRLGLKIIGRATWDPEAADFKPLALRIKESHAKAVYLGGYMCPTCEKLIREVRASIGSNGVLVAPDGFMPLADVIKAVGHPSERMYATAAGTTVARLGPRGRDIARRFGPPVPSGGGPPFAAQATEVMLDAIARSNGSRGSITSHLFRVRVRHGILGSFRINRNGDTTGPTIMVFQARHGRQRLFGVVTPPPRLLPR